MDGIIVKGIGSFYEILSGDKEYTCRAQKKLRRISAPVPGDHVRFEPGTGEEDGWLEEIYERKNQLIRPAVANVDMLVLVLAPVPQPDMMLIERLLLCAAKEKIQPAIVVNKNDLNSSLPQQIREEFSDSTLSVFSTSTVSGTGIDELYMALKGKLCCFAGQSAVGKSTLLNALCGLNLETGGLSRKTERGRHTTRRSELLIANGLKIMDTPGFSLFETISIDPQEVPELYPEYAGFADRCKFQPCMHDREPGCAVRAAVEHGGLNPVRYERYRSIVKEVRDAWKERYH